jgi:hypothetical protein
VALSTTPLKSPVGAAIVTDTALGAVADTDVRAGSTTVYMVDIDNTANSAASYVKLFNATAPTVGTTAPDVILWVGANVRKVFSLDLSGLFFTNLSMACVNAGGTAGVTPPSNPVIVRVLCT